MTKKKFALANNPLFAGPSLESREKVGSPYRELKINTIDPDPVQPRKEFDEDKLKELAASIKLYGVLNPILVRPAKTSGRYILVAGERRLRASILAGISMIPAIVNQELEGGTQKALSMQLVENLQRADLSPLERAQAIGALRDSHRLSIREIGDRLGISKSMVQRSLEILELPPDLINALKQGASESKVLMLAKIADEDVRASYLRDLDSLTRDQLERKLETSKDGKGDKASSPEDARIEDEIQRAIGLKVRLSRNAHNLEAGKLAIDFYSSEDLQELFRRLVSEAA